MALSPDGTINEDYYRQILDHLLRVSLPPADYAAEAERYIIREAILKVVLVDVLPRVTQPWFIQLAILNQLGSENQIGSYIVGIQSIVNCHATYLFTVSQCINIRPNIFICYVP